MRELSLWRYQNVGITIPRGLGVVLEVTVVVTMSIL